MFKLFKLFNFCKHDWMILSETTTKSKLELTMERIPSIATRKCSLPSYVCDPERKLIQIVTCKKCGALKRFVEII